MLELGICDLTSKLTRTNQNFLVTPHEKEKGTYIHLQSLDFAFVRTYIHSCSTNFLRRRAERHVIAAEQIPLSQPTI
jgi:hypothetical protein